MEVMMLRCFRRLAVVAFGMTVSVLAFAHNAHAQLRGYADAAHTQLFTRGEIQSHIRVRGWVNENSWPKNCNSNPFGTPHFLARIDAPGRAQQWVQFDAQVGTGYRPDVRSAGLACTEWSGFDHTIVLKNVVLYQGTSITLYVWNTAINNYVELPGAGRPTTWGVS